MLHQIADIAMFKHISLIIRREFMERVARKSFIITTIMMPLLMVALMMLPTMVMLLTGPENKSIAVVDNTGVIASELKNEGDLKFLTIKESVDSAKNNEDYDAVLVLNADVVQHPQNVLIFSHGSLSVQTESEIRNQLENIIEDRRIEQYEISDLKKIMEDVKVEVNVQTFDLDSTDQKSTSSMVSYMLGLFMMFMLYMFIMLYGQMVMTSIIEEKGNRVLEIVVSSVKPTHLMLGKILGIGSVAVTQVAIWAVLIFAFMKLGLPTLTGGVAADADADVDLLAMINMVSDTEYIMSLFAYLVLFLIGGYLFYSSIYAAIGSAVDNIQDASQLQTLAVAPIMIGMILSMSVVADPNSSLATWFSIIPFTSPLVMMSRLPFGVSVFEIVTSLVVLYASTLLMVWFSAKIYRVGIFMYGKKPTYKELLRWAKYK
jgi:ABC-2 type transport system permease protein